MKRNLLLVLLFFIQQGYSQSNPYFISAGPARSINDFYGLNGQNTLDPNSCYADNDVRTEILKAQPSYLRYPGGEVANYWDWQEGWFFRNMEDKGVMSLDMDFQSKIRLTSVFNGAIPRTFGGNFIADFKATLAHTGTKPLFVLNPLTSDKYYQIAMLLEAKLQNLNVKRVEIGNEFYLSKPAYMDKFPSAADYASTYFDFRSAIKDYLGTDVQVCAVASNKNDDGGTSDRSETWNSSVASTLGGNVDSYTIHQYRAATSGVSSINYRSIFSRANNDINELNNRVSQLGSTAPIWITEYNLFDKNQAVHGTWFHALYDSYLTLKFLENQRIEACNLHAQSGNYVFGSFYNVIDGLKPWGGFPGIGVSCNTTTSINKPTSVGIAMEFIAKSLMGASSVRKLEIGNSPTALNLDDGNSPIYAVYISKGSDNELLILNLSDQIIPSFNASLTGILPNGFGSNSIIDQISYPNASDYASGVTDEFNICTGVNGTLTRSSLSFPSSQIVALPAFSLTRVYQANAQRTRQVYAQKDTITAGSYTTLVALDNEGYNVHWNTGSDSTQITVNPTADITYTATYTPKDTSNHIVEIVTKSIKVLTPLSVSINASSLNYCSGSSPISLTTNVSGGSGTIKYIWITDAANEHSNYINQGISTLNNIFVSPDEDTRYIVYVTDKNQVAKAEIVISNPGSIKLKPEYVICANSSSNTIELEQTAQANVVYTYQINGGSINTISTVVNTPISIASISGSSTSSQGTITINANYANGTCISSAIAILTQYQCCNSGSLVIPPGSNLNDLKLVLGSIANITSTHVLEVNFQSPTTIYFNGDFHVFDNIGQTATHNIITDLVFTNCNLLFSEGASMEVEPGYTLSVNNTDLDNSCNKEWKGIKIDAGQLIMDRTSGFNTFKHSEIAINSLPGSKINLRRTKFIDNVIGIKSDQLSPNNQNNQIWLIRNVSFESANTMAGKYLDQYWNVGSVPMTAFLIDNTNVSVGTFSNSSGSVSISGLHNGIMASHSEINLENCELNNMKSDAVYPYKPGSWCIYGNNLSRIHANGITLNGIITSGVQETKGILMNNAGELNVNFSTFNSLDKGVETDWSNFDNFSVTENTFTDCLVGLEWWNSRSKTQANISKNHFLLSASTSHAQDNNYEAIHVFGTYNDFPLLIEGNDIHNHLAGIFAINLYGKQYEQKIINNLIDLDFTEDEVNANNFEFRGISLQNCEFTNVIDNNISWNTTNNTFLSNVQGIRFESCRGSLFSLNEITNMRKGFYGAGTCEETRLLCNTINESYPSGMFFDAIDLTEQGYYCGGSGNVWNGNDYDASLNNFKIGQGIPGVPIKWFYLGSSLSSNPLSPYPYDGNVIFPIIGLNSCQQTEPCGISTISGKYYTGDSLLRSDYLNKIIVDSINYPINLFENNYYDQVYAFSSFIEDNAFIVDVFYEQYFDAIKGGNIDKLFEVFKLIKDNEIALALIKNNSVLFQNIIEENLKKVNLVFLNKMLSNNYEDWGMTDNLTLTNVAYQPGILGGRGVYLARSLKKLRVEDGAYSMRQSSQDHSLLLRSEIKKIYPNPANDDLHIEFNSISNGRLILKDAIERELMNRYVSNQQMQLNLEQFSSGAYILEFRSVDGNVEKRKLIIQH